jgi:hypothetical protein
MRALATLAVLVFAAPVAAASLPMANGYGALDAPRDTDPLTLAQQFCTARISGDMSPLEKFFAPKLVRLLAETPPGSVPWQAFPDRPESCKATILNGYDDTVGVLVELTYLADARRWADTLNLERTPDSWLLNNVFYEGGGNLRFRLVNAAP